ncbi:MAG: hypothetical protein CVV24_06220 [Ignavibacteriae bacterium HGW-Ignavibacteriae-3]|nr:MAG: hypothetical protein CVV24_06220 [Ignavibacteriae bacterium HGW-Ignavibacteriae-3]
MKKSFLIILLFGLLVSCKENFEPFGDLKDKYVLNCVIKGDTTFQIASITRTYANDNYNPYSNTTDHNVGGALIRIWNGDSVVVLRDSILDKPANSKYQNPYHLYYTNKFKLVSSTIQIEAILPNGVRLTGEATVPNEVKFNYTDKVYPPVSKSFVEFIWNPGVLDNAYLTQVSIYYYKADDPKKTVQIAYVPASYINQGGVDFPIAPKPNNANKLVIDVATINKTMELISAGDPNKANYVILGPFLEVVSFGKSLSTYFNSITRTNDAYTVNLSEIDYSNISNGLGVFGVYLKNYQPFTFTHAFIKSFGYTPGLADAQAYL